MLYGDYTDEEKERLEAAGVDNDVESALKYNPQDGFKVTDIKKVWAAVNNYEKSDYPDYVWIIEFFKPTGPSEETFALLQGWHDYSGWDCQSGVNVDFTSTPRQAVGLLDKEKLDAYFEDFQTELLTQVNSQKKETWYEKTDKELGLK